MTIFSLVFGVLTLLIVAVCVLIGLKAGFFKSLVNLALTLVAVVLSVILARVIASSLAPLVLSFLQGMELWQDIEKLNLTVDALLSVAGALVAPILFFVLFLILKPLLMIVSKLLTPVLALIKLVLPARLLGALVGGVGGLVIAVSVLSPFTGYIGLAGDSIRYATEKGAEPPQIAGVALDEKEPISTVLNAVGGDLIFDALTTFTVEGEKANLGEELPPLVAIALNASELGGVAVADYGPEQTKALQTIAELLPESKLLPTAAAEILSALSNSWLKGEPFFGIAAPAMENNTLNDMVDELLKVFSTETGATIEKDVQTLVALLCHVTDPTYDFLSAVGNPDELIDTLCRKGMVSGLVGALSDNERMSPLVPTLVRMGVQMAVDSMNLSNSDMADKVTTILDGKTSAEYEEVVRGFISTAKALQSISSTETTKEDTVNKVVSMLDTITPASSEAIKEICQPEYMETLGIGADKAADASNMMSTMLDTMTTAKANGMSEEEYQKEAEAIGDMLNMVTSASSGNNASQNVFTSGDAAGSIDKSAEEMIQGVLDSQIMSETVNNTEMDLSNTLSESDKAAAEEAISSFLADGGDPETLSSLAAMFGISIG